MTVRVLLADDHRILRQGLRALLERESDLEVVGEASDGRTAVRLVRELCPDVVVLDVAMPELNGVEATGQIRSEQPGTRVLALSMHAGPRYITRMLEAGASGYLLKDSAAEELVLAIRRVAGGRNYLGAGVTDVVVHDFLGRNRQSEQAPRLTPREREVLQLLAEGHNTRGVARKLGVSVKTVETHRRQIMTKLKMDSVAELTKYAVREGITSLES